MAKKKVTIEDLAGMTQRGFEGVDKRFEQVDETQRKVLCVYIYKPRLINRYK